MKVFKQVDLSEGDLAEAVYDYLVKYGVTISNKNFDIKLINGASITNPSFVKLRFIWKENE